VNFIGWCNSYVGRPQIQPYFFECQLSSSTTCFDYLLTFIGSHVARQNTNYFLRTICKFVFVHDLLAGHAACCSENDETCHTSHVTAPHQVWTQFNSNHIFDEARRNIRCSCRHHPVIVKHQHFASFSSDPEPQRNATHDNARHRGASQRRVRRRQKLNTLKKLETFTRIPCGMMRHPTHRRVGKSGL